MFMDEFCHFAFIRRRPRVMPLQLILAFSFVFQVISYGPCQTPTLWFCVQRHKEIQNFRPSQYFFVSVQINVMGRATVEFLWADGESVKSR